MREVREIIEGQTKEKVVGAVSDILYGVGLVEGRRGREGGGGRGEASLKFLVRPLVLPIGVA